MYNKYLKTFIEVADYGSFTKAAEHLYISSVGVQKQISSLEKELDLKLFERTNQGVRLTYAGEKIYEDSKKIIEYCEKEIKAIKEKDEYCLKIANCMAKISDKINTILQKKYIENYIMLPFVLAEKKGMKDMEEEIKREFNAFIYIKLNDSAIEGWNYKAISTTNLKLVVSKESKLYEKTKISYSDLEGEIVSFFGNNFLEEYDQIKENIIRNVQNLTVINIDPPKLTLNDSISIMRKYPFVTVDGIDYIVSNSKAIPFEFNTDISVGLYTKKEFFE